VKGDDAASTFNHLLSPGRIGTLETRNRIAMSPMGSNLAEPDGTMGERITAYYEARARGGTGLLIVGVGAIAHPVGACNPNQVGISDDRFVPGLEAFVRRQHTHGARVAVQLQHAGKVATQDIAAGRPMWVASKPPHMKGVDLYDDLSPEELASATSFLAVPGAAAGFHEMTRGEIDGLVEQFADAALRARRAGFDGVEVHAAHGYIIASFLSPAANRREDEYGGSAENRSRLLCDVIRAVKSRAGEDFPVWCRLDGAEFRIEHGITPEQACATASMAEAAGADAVHVSAYADPGIGAAFTEAPLVDRPEGFVGLAAQVKSAVGVPVIAVGRIEPLRAEEILAAGNADFIAMGRKLLADPELPMKLARGDTGTVRPCIYGYTCVGRIFLNQQNRCASNPLTGREHELALEPAADTRRIVVVGGGPAGMEFARVSAVRGHDVTLLEASSSLGGALRAGAVLHAPNGELIDFLGRSIRDAGVDVRTGFRADAESVAALDPDVVVLATGAPYNVHGFGEPDSGLPVIGADQAAIALRNIGGGSDALPWRRAILVGGALEGLVLADALSRAGAEVAVVERGQTFGVGLSPPRRWKLLAALRERRVPLMRGASVAKIDGSAVSVGSDGQAGPELGRFEADVIVLCSPAALDRTEGEADGAPAHSGRACGVDDGHPVPVLRIGECAGSRYLEAAMLDAVRAAASV
jgi:2,4-dienoyl-CoA reductase-like NADH-dependent reductase (Old Yellow Enzyme family)